MVTQTRPVLPSRLSRMSTASPPATANSASTSSSTSSRSSSPPTRRKSTAAANNAVSASTALAAAAVRAQRPLSGVSKASSLDADSLNAPRTPLAPDILISHLSIVGGDHLPHNFARHHSTGADGTTTVVTGAASPGSNVKTSLNRVSSSSSSATAPLYVRRPSAPIAIPIHQSIRIRKHGSTPSSPLSARGEEKTSYFPQIDSGNRSPGSRSSSRTPSPKVKMSSSSRMLSGNTSNTSPARSPLSGSVRGTSNNMSRSSTKSPPPAGGFQNLLPSQLASLPRYHPAVMAAASARSTSSSQTSSNVSTPARQYSDAQMNLHLYQREMLAAAASAKKAAAAAVNAQSPSPPRLEPLGSPTEVMTPLLLNESGGYIAAGARHNRA